MNNEVQLILFNTKIPKAAQRSYCLYKNGTVKLYIMHKAITREQQSTLRRCKCAKIRTGAVFRYTNKNGTLRGAVFDRIVSGFAFTISFLSS